MTYKVSLNRARRRYRLFKKSSNKESETDFFELTILSVQLIFEGFRDIAEQNRSNPEIWEWWQGIKSDRVEGEALSYLSEIRNSVMHGLDYEHYELSLTNIAIAFKKPVHSDGSGTITHSLDEKGCLTISLDGKDFENTEIDLENSKLEFQQTPKVLKTKKAKKLGLAPPTKHLGETLKDRTIINIISLAIEYYSKKAEELELIYKVNHS
jgi:hypothetical protein